MLFSNPSRTPFRRGLLESLGDLLGFSGPEEQNDRIGLRAPEVHQEPSTSRKSKGAQTAPKRAPRRPQKMPSKEAPEGSELSKAAEPFGLKGSRKKANNRWSRYGT